MSFIGIEVEPYAGLGFPVLLAVAVLLSIRAKAISWSGGLAGALIATGIYLGGRWLGIGLLGLFFVSGSLATRWQRSRKEAMGVAQEAGGRRSWVNAAANGGVAAVLGGIAWGIDWTVPLAYPMMAAAISSATSDTLSSELGTLYGRRYRNILTWQSGPGGADGMISREGTLFGLAGAILIALPVGWVMQSLPLAIIVTVAGMVGNWSDSLLGATLQRQGVLNNHTVNFWSSLIAALFAGLAYAAF
jgi:uncharacterized protein (TIGR00297 family)